VRRRRWLWIVVVLVLVIGAFAARYVSIGPGGHHKFNLGGEVQDLPLLSPTLLGWILPGGPARIESVQFSPDGRVMYVYAIRGQGDQLASVTHVWVKDGVLIVDLRLTQALGARNAAGYSFGTRIELSRPLYDEFPPITIDASTGRTVPVETYIP
jgi:hypothetical protein